MYFIVHAAFVHIKLMMMMITSQKHDTRRLPRSIHAHINFHDFPAIYAVCG